MPVPSRQGRHRDRSGSFRQTHDRAKALSLLDPRRPVAVPWRRRGEARGVKLFSCVVKHSFSAPAQRGVPASAEHHRRSEVRLDRWETASWNLLCLVPASNFSGPRPWVWRLVSPRNAGQPIVSVARHLKSGHTANRSLNHRAIRKVEKRMASGNKQAGNEVSDRNMSRQEPEPKLRRRKGQTGIWEARYRRYAADGTVERPREVFGDEKEFPSKTALKNSPKWKQFIERINDVRVARSEEHT